jgi:hypothetical protein
MFSHQMLAISQMTTIAPVLPKEADYVPVRNRMRYQRYANHQVNKTESHNRNSYKDLLSFNLS